MKRYGRPHPAWGNGGVESRVSAAPLAGGAGPQIGVDLGNPEMLDALAHLARALCMRRQALPCRTNAPCDRMAPT
jgi:hypothetical protein